MFNSQADIISFIIICLTLFFLLSALIVVFTLKYQERKIAYSNSYQALIEQHSSEILKVEIEVQEQTFQNISRELHDNIGHQIACAKLKLNSLEEIKTDFKDSIHEIENIMSAVMEDIRDVSRSKSSELVYSSGLINALKFEVEQIKKLKLFDIECDIVGDTYFMEGPHELMIFRIIQEAIQNIIKHAEAKKIKIILDYKDTELRVSISDDGKGFGLAKSAYNQMGLKNMSIRAKRLGGQLKIEEVFPHGTCIDCIIPKKFYEKGKQDHNYR